jgi:hypothetical protein
VFAGGDIDLVGDYWKYVAYTGLLQESEEITDDQPHQDVALR